MKHVLFIIYLITICIGMAALTLTTLIASNENNKVNKSIHYFVIGMVIMNFYDIFIFYNYYLAGKFNFLPYMRIGDCFIAGVFAIWVNVEKNIISSMTFQKTNIFFEKSVILYMIFWMSITCMFPYQYIFISRWILIVLDTAIMVFALIGSINYICESVWKSAPRGIIHYIRIITIMLIFDFACYLWGEISIYWGENKFNIITFDIKVIFCLVVNVATVIMLYKFQFNPTYHEAISEVISFNIDIKMEELAKKYELTSREKEITTLIYNGKNNKDIAQELFISESTVKTHIHNVFKKLEVKNRVEIICMLRE